MRFPQSVVLLTVFVLVLGSGCPPKRTLVTLTNNGSDPITEFWIAPLGYDWGPSRISILHLGRSVSIAISPGTWDFKVQDSGLDSDHLSALNVAEGQELKLVWTGTALTRAKGQALAVAQ